MTRSSSRTHFANLSCCLVFTTKTEIVVETKNIAWTVMWKIIFSLRSLKHELHCFSICCKSRLHEVLQTLFVVSITRVCWVFFKGRWKAERGLETLKIFLQNLFASHINEKASWMCELLQVIFKITSDDVMIITWFFMWDFFKHK